MEKRTVRIIRVKPPVRAVNVPPVVKITPIIKPSVRINEVQFKDLIRNILLKMSESNKNISLSKKSLKGLIYDLVIKELRNKRFFFKNLNLNIIWKQVNSLAPEFNFLDLKNQILTPEEEFDRLCWLKANKMEYNKTRFKELQDKLENPL